MKSIIIFAKYPEPGKTKTRLIPFLGEEKSAELHKIVAKHTIKICKKYADEFPDTKIYIYYYGGTEKLMEKFFGINNYIKQSEGNLGQRMINALNQSFSENSNSSILIGTDCPDITVEHIQNAFNYLKNSDLVLGPAKDGGYYLIGMNNIIYELFPDDMPWGTSLVSKITLNKANQLKIKYNLLEVLNDIDIPSDLKNIKNHKLIKNFIKPELSIIIPTLNEEKYIAETLKNINADNIEIIVSDGGSIDGTIKLCKEKNVKVVFAEKGRGNQLNEGAKHANADILLFLHADTKLPNNYLSEIKTNLFQKNVVAGAFKFNMSDNNWKAKIVSFFINLRSRFFHLPYGDQAIFILKSNFIKYKGFSNIPIMEDYEFIKRIKKYGKIKISSESIVTSARRWQTIGYLKTFIINQLVILGYHLNISFLSVIKNS